MPHTLQPPATRLLRILALSVLLLGTPAAFADDSSDLAQQLANPVASLISVPLQLNYDSGFGPGDNGERVTLNIQPVIPVSISPEWNLISRTILPVITQSDVIPGDNRQSGLGDIVQSIFLSPKKPTASGWILGAGPVFLLPTATDDALGADQWGLGPTAVALKQTAGGWTVGGLANHIWSVAGSDARGDINATFLQPFVTKLVGPGLTATAALEATRDWENNEWTVPLNITMAKVTKIGSQLVSVGGGARVYLDSPTGGPEWGLRASFVLLFPR